MKIKYLVLILILMLTKMNAVNSETRTGFNSKNAIKKSSELEIEYSRNYNTGYSRLVGHVWLNNYAKKFTIEGESLYNNYLTNLKENGLKPKLMHCKYMLRSA